MENNLIIKTKLQLIPGITLLIFAVLSVIFKFIGHPYITLINNLLINLLVWLSTILGATFVFISLMIYIIKVIKKNNDYTLFKKTILISLEFIILLFIFSVGSNFINPLFYPSEAQNEAYIKKLNTLKIGKTVPQMEVDYVRLLFKDGSPLEAPVGMKSARPERQNNLLEIEKLDEMCHFAGTKKTTYFEKCADGDLYVRYGWDICFPDNIDCFGETYFEKYLIRNINGNYEIIDRGY
jgi:hypothetical protein